MSSIIPLPSDSAKVIAVKSTSSPVISPPFIGATGPRGPQGATGVRGSTGVAGADGTDGTDGAIGATGPAAAYVVQVAITDPHGAALTIDDPDDPGKAFVRVNSAVNGKRLIAVAMQVSTPSESGSPSFQIVNVTQGRNLLSTPLTVDAGEYDSSTASIPAVIDTAASHNVVNSSDRLRLDCDNAGIGTKGVIIDLTFG